MLAEISVLLLFGLNVKCYEKFQLILWLIKMKSAFLSYMVGFFIWLEIQYFKSTYFDTEFKYYIQNIIIL